MEVRPKPSRCSGSAALKRYAHSGCVPRFPAPRKGPGFEVRNLGSRRRGPLQDRRLGASSGGVAPHPPRRVERLAMAAFARYRSERQGGAGVGRGRAPAPKSRGPLLPSRTPTPRNTRVPLRAGCTPALVGRGWRAGKGDQGGAPETLAVLGFGSPETLRALVVRSPGSRPRRRDWRRRFAVGKPSSGSTSGSTAGGLQLGVCPPFAPGPGWNSWQRQRLGGSLSGGGEGQGSGGESPSPPRPWTPPPVPHPESA